MESKKLTKVLQLQKEPGEVEEDNMGLCPGEKCEHYGKATKYPRKCYYEPQCWKGYLDLMIAVIRIRFSRRG